ncbi:hypothetical protein HMPREF1981_00550 [Bacteroides pyogenes F0041]|uniref:Uncharacterized protein n=1 Tax=Bacteroides pyogenes F0041 TaxID=1321819 RepID=U2CCX6_9BACE|nr:hypothetical protein HMPREF1981_00550 [Bacteroides pyogenes F0041]MBB3896480.1 hypothetical protein [Bacteroides pyogenes]GAE23775.1 hypothetical protein JCM10003_3598 [Bacteroides pyogenes JCM 10003]SUV31207.1 Uncharacterised protein [Bacteroides pyogenes]
MNALGCNKKIFKWLYLLVVPDKIPKFAPAFKNQLNYLLIKNEYESIRNRFHFNSRFI